MTIQNFGPDTPGATFEASTPDGAPELTTDATCAVGPLSAQPPAERIRLSEQRYRALVQATASVVLSFSPEGAFIEPQASWTAYTGQPWEAHRGLGYVDMIHPDDRVALMDDWQAALQSLKIFRARGQRIWHAASHTYRHQKAVAVPILNADHTVREWVGITLDIEEVWRTETELARVNQSLQDLVMARTRHLHVLNRVTQIANRADSPEEALKETLAVLCQHLDWPVGHALMPDLNLPSTFTDSGIWVYRDARAFTRLTTALTQSSVQIGEGMAGQAVAHHRPVWVEDILTPEALPCLKDLATEIKSAFAVPVIAGPRVVAVIECFTPQQMPLDQALLEILAQVGVELGRVFERQEMHQLLMRLAYLDRFNVAGEFASGIAHEINQPLAAIAVLAATGLKRLERGADGVSLAEPLRQIHTQSLRAGTIIRTLRSLLKQAAPQRIPANINELIQEVVRLADAELRRNQIKVKWVLAEDLSLIKIDPTQIQQVFMNLLRNAIDAMQNADVRAITLTTRNVSQGIEVQVSDTGSGLDREAQAKLFYPFFTHKPQSMGLGLVIAQTILCEYAGRLTAENNPDHGACFTISLPTE